MQNIKRLVGFNEYEVIMEIWQPTDTFHTSAKGGI